jgi:hypothetical protein
MKKDAPLKHKGLKKTSNEKRDTSKMQGLKKTSDKNRGIPKPQQAKKDL